MAARIVNVSTRTSVDDYERMARSHVARDGLAVFGAAADHRQQRRHLRGLAHRLADDETLDCSLVPDLDPFDDDPDGPDTPDDIGGDALILMVFARSTRPTSLRNDPRRGLGWIGGPHLG
jgi:hypothetical protein